MPKATRTAAEAVAYMKALHEDAQPRPTGECLQTCREAWGLPSKYESAQKAWEATPSDHRSKGPAPLGAPVFWTGGSENFGHIAISDGNGYVWSTDLPTMGHVGLVTVDSVAKSWSNHTLVGWSSMLEGYQLPLDQAGSEHKHH